jgi:hypothetical protein
MSDDYLMACALKMLRECDAEYVQDARDGAPLNNSVIGSILSIEHKAPRWATEAAVRKALTRFDMHALVSP